MEKHHFLVIPISKNGPDMASVHKLLKLKVTPSFCFAFKIPDDLTATIRYRSCLRLIIFFGGDEKITFLLLKIIFLFPKMNYHIQM